MIMSTNLASPDATNASETTTPAMSLAQQPTASGHAVNDSSWRRWPRSLRDAIARAVGSIRSVGPYVAIELLLPGGSIIALALWTYRRRRATRGSASTVSTAAVPAERGVPFRCATPCTQR
jgi:hypothetical protein